MSKAETLTFATTVKVRDACLCLHVQRAARALARIFDEALRPVGLTNGQFSLLMALNRPQPARIADVAAVLAMDRTTLTASLKRLERERLIAIAVDRQDRRSRLLTLTETGRERLQKALPIWEEVHAELESRLPEPDALRRGLHAFSLPG
jgi:DNA-binding MarR family transcriptional regulator